MAGDLRPSKKTRQPRPLAGPPRVSHCSLESGSTEIQPLKGSEKRPCICRSLLQGGIPVGDASLTPKPCEILNRLEIRAHTAGKIERRHMLAAQLKHCLGLVTMRF